MKLEFPKRMPLSYSLGLGKWETGEPWAFTIDGLTHIIPVGFVCDLYSVPFPLSVFIPRDEPDNRPALIHDWLYATVGLRAYSGSPSIFNRAKSDEALKVACELCGLPAQRCLSIYSGVRLGGWYAWGKLDRSGHSLENPKTK